MNASPSQDLIKPMLALLKVALSPWNIYILAKKKKLDFYTSGFILINFKFTKDEYDMEVRE